MHTFLKSKKWKTKAKLTAHSPILFFSSIYWIKLPNWLMEIYIGVLRNSTWCIYHRGQEVYERDVRGKQSLPVSIRKSQIVFFLICSPYNACIGNCFQTSKEVKLHMLPCLLYTNCSLNIKMMLAYLLIQFYSTQIYSIPHLSKSLCR